MGQERCPACGEAKIVRGVLSAGEYGADRFLPHRTRPGFNGLPGVVVSAFRACASCGHLWSTLDPDALRDYIRGRGDSLAREQLDEFDAGLLRGLPDTALAREVAAKVAEVDAMARSGKPGEASRIFRELAGVTWDRANEVARKWPELHREEKLALLGWMDKKKVPADEFF